MEKFNFGLYQNDVLLMKSRTWDVVHSFYRELYFEALERWSSDHDVKFRQGTTVEGVYCYAWRDSEFDDDDMLDSFWEIEIRCEPHLLV